MKIATIIQARMASSRLPGKVKKEIAGYSMLWHVWQRAKRIKPNNQTIIATGVDPRNEWIRKFCRKYNIDHYSGHDTDVLERYYQTAKRYQADTIIRITSDCPLLDPKISAKVVKEFIESKADYCGLSGSFPNGIDTELFTFKALQKTAAEAKLPSEREHVTLYMKRHPERFQLHYTEFNRNLYHLKLSVDREEDLKLVRHIFQTLFKPDKVWFGIDEVAIFLEKHPDLLNVNKNSIRDEWRKKAAEDDKVYLRNAKRR